MIDFSLVFKIVIVISLTMSCTNTRKISYFNNIQDSEIASNFDNLEPVIQRNDLLSISVSSLNPEASRLFNAPNISDTEVANLTGRAINTSGYLVDQEGMIEFTIIGKIEAAGMTKTKLKENISKKLIADKLLLDPIINIRYLNYKVTVLGEVARPTVVNVANEKITLLEAL